MSKIDNMFLKNKLEERGSALQYEAVAVKIIWYRTRERHIDQQIAKDSPERFTQIPN